MTPPRCDATHDGQRCQLDASHWPDTRHVVTTPTSITRWDPVTVDEWKVQNGPSVLRGANKCQTCNKPLHTRGHGQRYCGDECRRVARRDSNRRNKAAVARRARQNGRAA